jgi:drug/metabolite transporter (DMT)-like permease
VGLATSLACVLLQASGMKLHFRQTWRIYAAGALGVYGGLLPVYYASQFIPSGLISVLFGLAPVLSSLLAARWLDERAPSAGKLAAMAVALCGLAVVFHSQLAVGIGGAKGLAAVLGSVTLFTVSGLLVKRQNLRLHPLTQTTGTLLVALPVYLLTWLCKDGSLPVHIEPRALLATAYLAIFGSLLSFMLYFSILQRLPLSRVSLITLVSPVLALALGAQLAGEHIPESTLAGGAVILCALAAYHFEEAFMRWLVSLRIG